MKPTHDSIRGWFAAQMNKKYTEVQYACAVLLGIAFGSVAGIILCAYLVRYL